MSQSVGQSVSRSVGQSVSRSVGQSVGRSVGQSVSRSVSVSVSKSVGQSVRKSAEVRVIYQKIQFETRTLVCLFNFLSNNAMVDGKLTVKRSIK